MFKPAIRMPGGQSISNTDQMIALAGSRTNYPFDQYNVTFFTFITGPDGKPISTADTLTGGVHGFKIDANPITNSDISSTDATKCLHVHISRATSTLFLATSPMASLWSLALPASTISLLLPLH